ncbi:MAG: TIGR04255 family protein [Acidimicrobiales bacterium]
MFRLNLPGRYHLARAPLAQALVQVRFPMIARLQTAEGIAPVQERLRDRYPYMKPRTEITVQALTGPGGQPPAITGGVLYELADDDGRIVTIGGGSAALSVGAVYEGVDEFAERMQEVLTVLAEEARVPRCDRLGARYLTVVALPPGRETEWKDWFRRELTGWAASEVIDDETVLEAGLSQVSLRAPAAGSFTGPAEIRANVQHGLVPAGSGIPGNPPITTDAPSYIISLDVFCEAPQPFDAAGLRRQLEDLHHEIDAFFRWSLTREGEEYFGFEALP